MEELINYELINNIEELIEMNKQLIEKYPNVHDSALKGNLKYLTDLKKAVEKGIQ